jgi:Zn-dependent protease with chaperone function
MTGPPKVSRDPLTVTIFLAFIVAGALFAAWAWAGSIRDDADTECSVLGYSNALDGGDRACPAPNYLGPGLLLVLAGLIVLGLVIFWAVRLAVSRSGRGE